ncbi:MAG: MarR family winged helix-turn-helix transcriptional regulator [Candidatus Omnitrophota bacterium]
MSIFRELGVREGKDRQNEEVVYSVARAYMFLDQRISRLLNQYNLSPAKFNILLMVKHVGLDKGMPQNALSKQLLVTTSNITRMVDKLENEDCVERLAQKGDRRVNLIRITDKGSKLLDKVWPQYKELVDGLISEQFSFKEKQMLSKMLQTFK